MSAKGQLVIPKSVRERLRLLPGCKVGVSVDAQERLILTPASIEPADLFAGRPPVVKILSLEDMDDAIAKGARGGV